MRKVLAVLMIALWMVGCETPTETKTTTPQVSAITASPVAGTVAAGTQVTLTTATSGATIYYTTDGSTPSKASAFGTANGSTATVTINATTTIKALATKSGHTDSVQFSATYTVLSATSTPTFYSDSGLTSALSGSHTVTGTTTIYLKAASDATIRYTVDNSDPTTTSLAYNATAGISISATTTIKAKAFVASGATTTDSAVATLSVTVGSTVPAAVIQAFGLNSNTTNSVDAGQPWIEFKINNATSLGAEWTLNIGTGVYKDELYKANGAIAFADGDIVRYHGVNWTGTSDTAKGTDGKWDITYNSQKYDPNGKAGFIYVSDSSGKIVDLVSYKTDKSTASTDFVSDSGTNTALTILTNAVTAGLWDAATYEKAFALAYSNTTYARLKSGVTHGQSASDWEESAIAVTSASWNPTSLTTAGGTATLTVVVAGTGAVSTVTADVSAFAGSSTQAMTGSSGAYTYALTVPANQTAANYSVPVTATASNGDVAKLSAVLSVTSAAGVNHVVISQVFGGNGASNAYNTDYVELYNPTSGDISLTGYYLQYGGATSTTAPSSSNIAALSGTIKAGRYFLVQGATSTGGNSIPTPDCVPTTLINLSGTAGRLVLATSSTGVTSATDSAVVDFVGFGTTAVWYEGSGPAAAPSTTTATFRTPSGNDTNDNKNDFVAGTPNPRNSATVP